MTLIPSDYNSRTYAGWLGKCIGVRFGAPLEGWSYQQIKDTLGTVEDYLPLPPGKIFKPDDDTAMPMILVRALEDYGADVTAAQFGETWLNYLGDQHGTLWWGGYGISTEHTAYLNLAAGVPAPQSGSMAMNGAMLAEQIGGQIFSDVWGLVAPNNPRLAAKLAARAASVSHAGDGIRGSIFIAVMVSLAFSENDPRKLIETALTFIPDNSEYARVVNAVREFHRQNPVDWRAAYRFIAENFGYDRYPGEVHIIPNTGIIVMALLYGAGDFSRTIQIANMGGWDTDCNVGNVGAIMGVAVGLDGIPMRWRMPMNDILVAASVIGTRNLLDMPACADLFCNLGRQLAGENPSSLPPRCHFQYPGSTHGFLFDGFNGKVIALKNDGGGLHATVRKLNKKGEVRLFVKTGLRPEALSANYYGASFSPKIYPGQTVRAAITLPADAPPTLRAGLFVRNDNRAEYHHGVGVPLIPGETTTLTYAIPPLHNALLSETGVVLKNTGQPWSGVFTLNWFDWDGTPQFSTDFELARAEFGAISQWTYLRGYWRLESGAYHGSGVGINETYSGDITWQNYRLTVQLTPLLGDHHHLNVRVQGARRSYAVGFAPDGRLVVYKNRGEYHPVAGVSFPWRHGQSYRLTVVAVGSRLRVWVDDAPLLAWTDADAPYLHGQIGLSNFAGCHTRFERVEVSIVPLLSVGAN